MYTDWPGGFVDDAAHRNVIQTDQRVHQANKVNKRRGSRIWIA
jgi:hypothetical protein